MWRSIYEPADGPSGHRKYSEYDKWPLGYVGQF